MSDRLPCGGCDIGVYCVTPVLNGLAAFRDKPTRKAALKAAPRCSVDPIKICAGARDWIAGATFPLTREAIAQIEEACR